MSFPESAVERIEQAEGLDPAAKLLKKFWSTTLSSPRLRDVLSGRQLGHPLHPAAVLLPAGSLLSATILDFTGGRSLRPAARRLIAVGLLSAVPTAVSGWSDWLDTDEAESRVGLIHATSNALGLSAYALSWRKRRKGGSGRLSSLAGATALGVGGWLGGHLAFAQGVGVDTTAFQSGPAEWTDVAATTEIDSTFRSVDVDGVALLVTRVGGQVTAIEDRCTHRGAPLSEGEREDECVVCPWHGSRFELRTGAAVQGPATRPQPVYEVRDTNGRVEIRRAEPRALRKYPV
jgi:nitrite reductase/ring-hydroxylating ferredoxin subunit/uncharacterized membrane protein